MCGITGIATHGQRDDLTLSLQRMTKVLWHRGPDGNGYLLANEDGVYPKAGDDTPADVSGSSLPYAPEGHIASATGRGMPFERRWISRSARSVNSSRGAPAAMRSRCRM